MRGLRDDVNVYRCTIDIISKMQDLKVLHLENLSGVASCLSRAQRNLGVRSDVLITWPNKFGYDVDYEYIYNGSPINIIRNVAGLLNEIRKYDVLHVHGGIKWNRLDIVSGRVFLGKPMMVHYHGSETRMGYGTYYPVLADRGIVSTPDLLSKWKGFEYVPNPIQTQGLGPRQEPEGRTRVVHIPSNRTLKGTDLVLEAVEILFRSDIGGDFQFELVEGVDHRTALEKMAGAHIIIDSISRQEITGVPGLFGLVSLEAMAMGRVAVAYIDPRWRNSYPAELPIISPERPDPGSLAACLELLIRDRGRTIDVARSGPGYVRQHHDPEKQARWYIEQYVQMLEG
jgi:hypothetical protein